MSPARGTARKRLCRALVIGFTALWALALMLLLAKTFGLFGQERDPLAGVFLIPLGLPWTLLPLPGAILAILAPGLNLAVLAAICRVRAGRA